MFFTINDQKLALNLLYYFEIARKKLPEVKEAQIKFDDL